MINPPDDWDRDDYGDEDDPYPDAGYTADDISLFLTDPQGCPF